MSRPLLAVVALLLALSASLAYSNGGVGRGTIKDDKNNSDRVILTMIGVSAAPKDRVYEAWLVTDNGAEQTSLGNLKVESDGVVRLSVTRDENFFARYNKLRVSLEPKDKRDPKQAGSTTFQGEIALPVMAQLRTLLVHFPDAPGGTPLTIGLRTQSSLTLKSTNMASAAAATGDMNKVKENAEAIVNIVEGSKGPNFGDLNNNRSVQNPGDGYGLLTYVDQVTNHVGLLADSEGATPEMKAAAKSVQISAGNIGTWAAQIRDNALLVLQAADASAAVPLLDDMTKKGMVALNGVDANDNGIIEPIEGEGGAITAYAYAQSIGQYDVEPVQAAAGEPSPTSIPQQDGQGPAPSEQNLMPDGYLGMMLVFVGLLVGTSAIAILAFLWVRSKMGLTGR